LDAVAFTGGIGENSAALRAACCDGLGFLGIEIDPESNANAARDRPVSRGSTAVFTVATNEEVVVARRAYRCLTAARIAAV
jgi:acetate kinase